MIRSRKLFTPILSSHKCLVIDLFINIDCTYSINLKKTFYLSPLSAAEYLATLEAVPAHVKRDSCVPKLLNLVMKGGGSQGLDRTLGNLLRVIPKAQTFDFQAFLNLDGLGVLTNYVISKGLEDNAEISKK